MLDPQGDDCEIPTDIPYKGVETSPEQMRFKTLKESLDKKSPKRRLSTSLMLGLSTSFAKREAVRFYLCDE